MILSPSTYPISLRPCRNARKRSSKRSGDALLRNPTTGIADCCARATSGQAMAAPPASVMNSRRLMCAPLSPSDCTLPHGCRKCWVVHHGKFARRLAALGHKPRRRSGPGVGPCPQYLRSRRNFMHRTEMTRSARIGRAQMQQTTCADAPLFDHVIGNAEQRRRHGEAERSGSLVVDDQLEFARLHHRQVARLGTLENAAGICADLTTRAGLAP